MVLGIDPLLRGAIAGAVATTALHATTYLDMVVRARPASSTPERSAARLAQAVGLTSSGNEAQQAARVSGLGPLLGITAGVSVGVVLGALRGMGHPRGRAATAATAWALAMLAGNGPMTLLGVTDPRSWTVDDWLTDVAPHLAYAVAASATLAAIDG